jgi:hypothetical protein
MPSQDSETETEEVRIIDPDEKPPHAITECLDRAHAVRHLAFMRELKPGTRARISVRTVTYGPWKTFNPDE